MMLSSVGILKYTEDKLIVEVDPDIGCYYRYLMPKYYGIKRPLFPSYISVVRKEIRLELGLTATSSITRSPDLKHDFHITIGNFK